MIADTSSITEVPYGQFQGNNHRPMMAMIEITNKCNMACPVCFSDANNPSDEVPFEEVVRRLQQLCDTAGPIPVQISGGEPTLHSALPEIIQSAVKMGFRNIELITNGIRISKQPEYLKRLVDLGLTAVYLQFDSLNPETLRTIRGQDMSEVREKAVASVREAGVCCTLAVAVTKGLNDHEVGDIIQYGIKNIDTIRAINFQSATKFTGRFDVPETGGGYSLPNLLRLIEKQTNLPADGFRSEFLGHPSCNAMSLLYVVNGELKPLFNYISRETLLAFLGDDSRGKVLDLFMGKERFCQQHIKNPHVWKALLEAAPIFGANPMNVLKSKHILIFAKSFMEKSAMEDDRIHQCAYGISGADGVFSFCSFNNLYRFPQLSQASATKG